MTHATDSDIERILRVRDADLGLFVLAMHSLMERALKEKYSSTSDFGDLIIRYKDDFYEEKGTIDRYRPGKRRLPKDDWNDYLSLKNTITNHYVSNRVRHEFAIGTEEEAKITVACFLTFAKIEGWTKLQTIKKLELELANWNNHDSYQSEEFKRAILQIEKLKAENDNLAKKANELQDLQNQFEVITAREKSLKAELAETESRLSKKDEKLQKVRQDANDQYLKFRAEKEEIQAKMKEYEATKQYLSILERISSYTKTRHDYEQSIISLSREQKDILDQINLNKDFLVKGAAGTGKSLVLIKTLEKAVTDLKGELGFEENQNSFRLLTYSKSLVKYNQYVTQLLQAEVPEDSITTAHSFLYAMLKKFFPQKDFCFDFEAIPQGTFAEENFNARDIFTEANEFIWANCITKEQYVDELCDREGMKYPLKKQERQLMWKAVEEAEEKLSAQNLWPLNYAAKKIVQTMQAAIENNQKDFCCEYSFVDEAQDLPPVMLAIIKTSTNRAVFLAGDSDQSIYRKGFNWNKSGIDIKGRTRILKTNFRNTMQIHQYAENYRSKLLTKDTTTMPEAFRPGPPVEHIVGKNTEDAMNQMIEQVKLLMSALNYEEENICIIANSEKKLKTMQEMLDSQLGVESNIINDDFDFSSTEGIRLCKLQSCKGLDFPVVLFLADHRLHGAEEKSAYDEQVFLTQQYNMVYVALTRAMEMLYVYTVKGSSFGPYKELE